MDYTDIVISIRKIVRSINLESKRIQKDFGVSIPQLLTLGYLSQQDEFVATQKELINYLNLNSSTVTGIISRLEKKGYLARLPKMKDKRITRVCLTAKGQQLIQTTPDILHDKLTDKLSKLPASDVNKINDSMNKLIGVLGIEDVDASPLLIVEDPSTEG